METSQQNFNRMLQYGNVAEELVFSALKLAGFYSIPKYLYVKNGAPSIFGLRNKYCVPDLDVAVNGFRFWIEVKRKASRDYYPDTGFPVKNYTEYLKVQEITGNKVYILFIDDKHHSCYGNWLDRLNIPHTIKNVTYPLIETRLSHFNKGIIYFPIALMDMIQEEFINIFTAEGLDNLINSILKENI